VVAERGRAVQAADVGRGADLCGDRRDGVSHAADPLRRGGSYAAVGAGLAALCLPVIGC